MSLEALQSYTAIAKYGRYLDDLKRRETWDESVSRVEEMMLGKFPVIEGELREAYAAMLRMEVLGSQRALQFGGPPILQKNARLYNCAGTYIDRLRAFQEVFYLLLCGSGVGFSVQERHIRFLPKFSKKRLTGRELPTKSFVVPDCIEGWADAQGVLLSSYHEEPIREFEEYADCNVEFDLSLIRRKGSKLSYGIGKAPGPKPLANSLDRNRRLLEKTLSRGLEKLDSITAYDILMHEADAVVSGGVRRSATICLFDHWDLKMAQAKTGNWRHRNPQRGRSNNSASLLRNEVSWEEFYKLFKHTKEFGEPGFYWTAHPDIITNPCVEVGFYPRLQLAKGRHIPQSYQGPVEIVDGLRTLSGIQFCNLSTINGRTIRDANDFYERCRLAATIGTAQAAFTDFPYLGQVTEEIVRREALLGVSIAGVMHHSELLLNPEVQQEGARVVCETNQRLAAVLGINPAARSTCMKPDGNSASLLGSFSGVHPGKFRKGFRIVQCNKQEAPYQHFQSVNPEACEESVWSTNKADDIIRFCVEYEGKLEDELTAVEMLENVRSTFVNWVGAGKIEERCTRPGISHNVSNTVRVRDDEWDAVAKYIYDNRNCFSGVSLIGWYGDRDYAQAPYTSVFSAEEIDRMYGAKARKEAKPLLEQGRFLFSNLWDACLLALDEWDLSQGVPSDEQQVWAQDVRTYVESFFDGEVRRATYCLKDEFNRMLYEHLKSVYRPVDYTQMIEKDNGTNIQQELACAGGACEL